MTRYYTDNLFIIESKILMGKLKTYYSWNIRLEDQQGEDGSKNQLNTMESDSPPCHFSWDILHTRNGVIVSI